MPYNTTLPRSGTGHTRVIARGEEKRLYYYGTFIMSAAFRDGVLRRVVFACPENKFTQSTKMRMRQAINSWGLSGFSVFVRDGVPYVKVPGGEVHRMYSRIGDGLGLWCNGLGEHAFRVVEDLQQGTRNSFILEDGIEGPEVPPVRGTSVEPPRREEAIAPATPRTASGVDVTHGQLRTGLTEEVEL